MERPEFTREQEEWLCEIIGDWYLNWKRKITDGRPHWLGVAKENLKYLICNIKPDPVIVDIIFNNFREKDA